jgi:probable F420-dependent oxidoreductase
MGGGKPDLGRVGVWTWSFDQQPFSRVRDAVGELDGLGFGAVWFGEGVGREAVSQAAMLLGASERIVVAPGIANIYRHHAQTLARAERALHEAYPGRFLLGLGVGAKVVAESVGTQWTNPIEKMRTFLDAMDATPMIAPGPSEPPPRVLAAIGPRMLRLAAERTAGAHPFLVPFEHTVWAREIVGPDAFLAVHQSVLIDKDPMAARDRARAALQPVIANVHVVPTRWQHTKTLTGLTDEDLENGGSDRFVDAMIANGTIDTVAERVHQRLDAGADHVCISVGVNPTDLELAEWRQLADALL